MAIHMMEERNVKSFQVIAKVDFLQINSRILLISGPIMRVLGQRFGIKLEASWMLLLQLLALEAL